MTIVGLDDTDSRELGMCTTFVAHKICNRLEEIGTVQRAVLVRLNPSVEYKTRGNAALAIHTDVSPERSLSVAKSVVTDSSVSSEENTNPGIVVQEGEPSSKIKEFSLRAVREKLRIERAKELVEEHEMRHYTIGNGRGIIGSLAAIGAWSRIQDNHTYEYISYRPKNRWSPGKRDIPSDPFFDYSDREYPLVWDTVDRTEEEVVAVPNTPCPILYGIRGDSAGSVMKVARGVNSSLDFSPIGGRLFYTNQGTDEHLVRASSLSELENGKCFSVTGEVSEEPEARRGGHVFFSLRDGSESIDCVAFEPTKRFRHHVRKLKVGDKVTALGEFEDNTIKLEKICVTDLKTEEKVNPQCSKCGKSMESAGKDKGFRCRQCSQTEKSKTSVRLSRELELGWYEVPPFARRHISKPLIRGGFDMKTHPEC